MRFFLESEQPNIPGLTLAESVKPGIRKRHTEAYVVVLIPQPLDHLAAGGGGGGGTRSRGFRPSPHLPRAVRHSANRAPPPRVWGGGGGLSTILLAVGGGGELVSNLWGLGGARLAHVQASPETSPRTPAGTSPSRASRLVFGSDLSLMPPSPSQGMCRKLRERKRRVSGRQRC